MRTIYIRKLRYEEAFVKLERELHEAFLAGEEYVEVLHGIGEGILKKMTIEFVDSCGFAKLLETDPMFRQNPGSTLVQMFPPSQENLKRWTR